MSEINTSIIEQAKDLAETKSTSFKHIRAKGVSFQLAQLALAEVFTKRLVKLGNTVVQLEDKVFEVQNLEALDPSEILSLYHMANKSLMHATDYVQKVTNQVDWADLEAQLIILSEDQGDKINLDVSRGAEYLLKRLSELQTNIDEPQKIVFPDNVGSAFKNVDVTSTEGRLPIKQRKAAKKTKAKKTKAKSEVKKETKLKRRTRTKK